jgi:hypothetical protein
VAGHQDRPDRLGAGQERPRRGDPAAGGAAASDLLLGRKAAGEAKNTYGTGNFLVLNTGGELYASKSGLLTTVAYQLGAAAPVYGLEGSVAVTGAAVQWLRDQLGIISGAAQSEGLASQVDDTSGLYFVPAFSGLFDLARHRGTARQLARIAALGACLVRRSPRGRLCGLEEGGQPHPGLGRRGVR